MSHHPERTARNVRPVNQPPSFENAINAIGDNGLPLGLGNKPDVAINPAFVGQYDEIRLRGGTLSADRIKADYDMIANRDFCTYGKVGKWND